MFGGSVGGKSPVELIAEMNESLKTLITLERKNNELLIRLLWATRFPGPSSGTPPGPWIEDLEK